MTHWNQVSLVRGNAEIVTWLREPHTGAVMPDGWTVARVYAPMVGACEKCGNRTRFPESKVCVRCMP